jgi:hypothetical protein
MDEQAKKIPPKPKPTEAEAKQYWKDMDNYFFTSINQSNLAYKTNLTINILVVIIGTILIAYSIIYSAWKGMDVYSVAFGGIGIVAFISTLFLTPQRYIHNALSTTTRMQIVVKTFEAIWEAAIDKLATEGDEMTPEQLKDFDNHLVDVAVRLAEKLQISYISDEQTPSDGAGTPPSSPSSGSSTGTQPSTQPSSPPSTGTDKQPHSSNSNGKRNLVPKVTPEEMMGDPSDK